MQLCRPRNGHDPGLPRQQLGERNLRRGRALLFGDAPRESSKTGQR